MKKLERSILKGLVSAAAFALGCSGAASNQPSDSNPPATDDGQVASGDTAALKAKDTGSPNATSTNEAPESCGGNTCEAGQSCIEYYGITGKPLYICGVPCKENEPNEGCPEGMQCQVIPDGPTQCVKLP